MLGESSQSLVLLEAPGAMPVEPADFEAPTEASVSSHGVEFRCRFRKVVVSDVVTNGI